MDHLIYLKVTNRAERFVAGISKLPCVANAHVISDSKVAIYWKNGTQGIPCNIYPERHDHRRAKWPQDKKTLQEMGDCEVAKLAGALRGDSFLLLPGGDCHVAISGAGLDRDVYRAIEMCDQRLSSEQICEKRGGWTEFPKELCEALIRHRSSFGDAYFAWAKRKIVAEIETEKRAEREREEKDAAERKRMAEENAKRKAAELEPTVKWTPENARKGGMRFYAFYKDLHWSDDPPVPYEFWPRSTQPGDKWKHRLRENSVQAFGSFFGAHEQTNIKIQEDIAAGCKRVKGQLRPETIQWSISCDFPVAKDDPVAYARIPMLVSANLNPTFLLREWNGVKDADKVIPLGPKSGAEKSLFGDTCAVIVFNDGSAEIIPARELTYARIYRRAAREGNGAVSASACRCGGDEGGDGAVFAEGVREPRPDKCRKGTASLAVLTAGSHCRVRSHGIAFACDFGLARWQSVHGWPVDFRMLPAFVDGPVALLIEFQTCVYWVR